MQNQSASVHTNSAPARRIEFASSSRDGPSHLAFGRLEGMKAELQEVSTHRSGLAGCRIFGLMGPSRITTLKKGFNRLHEKYAESLTKVAALERELGGFCNGCQRLGVHIVAANNANSALRKVRIFYLHPAWAQTR